MNEADEEIKDDETQAPTFPINLTVENGIDKRTKIIKELYTSENIYVTNLKQMINGYLEPLKKSKILTSKVISGIFSNVEIIYKFHLFFSTSLTQKVESWDDDQLIGDIFLSMAPYLKLYSQYCANYDYSISLVQLHKKTNPQFSQFLVDCQKNELFKGSYITSFLILPIQRIPRYEMFLKELLKKTRENHPDAKNIAKSLDLVSELAKSVNESCEKAENIHKITEISKAINMEKLLKPTRVYCREDDVELSLEGYMSNSKCYIFNDLIVLTIKKSKIISKNYISYQLGLSWIYEKTVDSIQMVTPTVTMIIKFADINTKISWQNEVTNNINKLAERSSKTKKQRAEYRIEEEGGLFVAHSITPTTEEHPGEKRKKKNRLLDSWRTDKRSKSKSKRITIAVSEPSASNVASLSQSFLDSAPEKRKSLPHDKLQALEAVLSARGSQSNGDVRMNEKFRSTKTNTLTRSNQSSADLNLNNFSLYGTAGKMKAKKKRRDISDIFNQMNSVSTDV